MPQEDQQARSSAARPSPAPRPDATPARRCFIVDDEPAVRKTVASTLSGDIELAGFGSAQELLDAWRPEHPDIIFLDIALDRSDAIDVIRALAARKFRGAVQLMSGLDHTLLDQVRRVGEQHGLAMLPPLAKPFRAGQIQAVVQSYFGQKRRDIGDASMRAGGDEDFRLALGARLEEILANGWLQFYYQPKLDLQRKCVVGAEVLARCRQTAIDLAHHFGATVVAEGIEKRSELQALTAMGCDVGQGFLFAPPMPQDRLIALLQELAQKFAVA